MTSLEKRGVVKLLLRLLLLASIVSAVQLTIVPRLQRRKDVRALEKCLAQDPDVLLFCDSTNAWIDAGDEDRRSIAALLDEKLPDAKVGVVERGAYHLQVYEAFVDLLIARGVKPRAVVIPINMRSFSPEWDQRPEYQFDQSQRDLRHADDAIHQAASPLLSVLQLGGVPPVSQDQFKNAPVYHGRRIVGRVRDFDNPRYATPSPERTRNKFIYHYMYALDGNHRKLAALARIVEKSRAADLNVLFYFTPLDHQTGEQHLPGEFRAQVEENVAAVFDQIGNRPAPIVNMSLDLPADDFSYHLYPNEHLRDTGRKHVAANIAAALEQNFGIAATPRVDDTTRTAADRSQRKVRQ